ncbi:hypothetical protein [Aquibacillus saliphilus]|uniref:hypothetical protein n=1 Tax=Aquibacillus saliphilus TaxID=1909422 RepID=UPI001CF0202D|nr:hypothetical protein [Aquibacillus saliphilus]
MHYQDKFNFLNQMEENLLNGLGKQLKYLKPDVLLLEAEKGQFAVEVFQYILMNEERFHVFLGGE